jgi:hypothetical protein
MKPAPMPWILCGPGSPPDSTGEASGSTAIMRSDGLRAFSTWPTPVMVPPVPTPEMTISTAPAVSFQISSAVVARWMAGLAGFSNWLGLTAPGSRSSSSGHGDGALHALLGRGQHQLGAQQGQHLAALDRHADSGMTRIRR